MIHVPVREKEVRLLEDKDFSVSDFKVLYKEPQKKIGNLTSEEAREVPSWPTVLELPSKDFPELSEKPGSEVMLVVKGVVKSLSENRVAVRLDQAATVHGKVLSASERKGLSKSQFAIPSKAPGPGSYPIPDAAHARNALARVSQHGTPEEKAKVRAAVKRKFPGIDVAGVRKEMFGR